MLEVLIRFCRYLMPHFRCELKTALTCREVEEKLRGSLRTGFLRNRIKHPFTGTVGAAAFKIGIDSLSEDSPTYLRGHIEEVNGETRIRVIAGPRISDMIGSLAMGIIPCSVVVYILELEMPTNIAVAIAGGSILAVLIRRFMLQSFWEELDDGIVNLEYILDASVAWRTHDRFGVLILEVEERSSK